MKEMKEREREIEREIEQEEVKKEITILMKGREAETNTSVIQLRHINRQVSES